MPCRGDDNSVRRISMKPAGSLPSMDSPGKGLLGPQFSSAEDAFILLRLLRCLDVRAEIPGCWTDHISRPFGLYGSGFWAGMHRILRPAVLITDTRWRLSEGRISFDIRWSGRPRAVKPRRADMGLFRLFCNRIQRIFHPGHRSGQGAYSGARSNFEYTTLLPVAVPFFSAGALPRLGKHHAHHARLGRSTRSVWPGLS